MHTAGATRGGCLAPLPLLLTAAALVSLNLVAVHDYYLTHCNRTEAAGPKPPHGRAAAGKRAHSHRLQAASGLESVTKLRHVATRRTWGQRCGKVLFVYGDPKLKAAKVEPVPSTHNQSVMVGLPTADGHWPNRSWKKSRDAYAFIARTYGTGPNASYDWVLKANDDSYVFVENLLAFTKQWKQDDPYYYGFNLGKNLTGHEYIQGAAILMSRYIMERMVAAVRNVKQCPHSQDGLEDIEMAKCLLAINVTSRHAVDAKGGIYFSPTHPLGTVNYVPNAAVAKKSRTRLEPEFLLRQAPAVVKSGLACCSERMVAFHHVAVKDMWLLEYLTYRLKVDPRP